MTPKEKAEELIGRMYSCPYVQETEAKRCGLIAVDEIISVIKPIMLTGEKLEYWQEVKQEINKL